MCGIRETRRIQVLAAVSITVFAVSAHAQMRIRRAPVDMEAGRYEPPEHAPGRAVISPSAPMVNLLERAEEGIQRADWKLAIDSLQRIIESDESSLFHVGGAETGTEPTYTSVQMYALRVLSRLPADGLEAYRILYDGQAEHLLRRGLDTNDLNSLRSVVDRFLLTSSGDDAADALSSRLLDVGRAAGAVEVIDLALGFIPDPDVSEVRLLAKRAVGLALLGRENEARSTLDSIERSGDADAAAVETVQAIARLMAERSDATSSRESEDDAPPMEPVLVDPLPWHYRFSEMRGGSPSSYGEETDAPLMPPWQMVVGGDDIYVRSVRGLSALRADDLGEVWSTTGNPDPLALSGPLSWEAISRDLYSWIRPPDDDLFGSVSASHGLVYAIDRQGDMSSTDASNLFNARRFNLMPGVDAARGLYLANRLVAYDASSGAPVWSRGLDSKTDGALGDVEFRSVPLAVGDDLWVPYFRHRDYYVGVLDPKTGALRKEVPLCSVAASSSARRPAQPLAHGYGRVYVPSGHGVLFAIDTGTGTVRWGGEYGAPPEAESSTSTSADGWWEPAPPLVTGGVVVLCPSDHHELVAFSAATGRKRWSRPVPGAWYPIAADDRHVWLGGTSVSSISLDDGQPVWTTRLQAQPTGRGVRVGNRLMLPTAGGLVTLDANTGAHMNVAPAPPHQGPAGNLVATYDALFSVDAIGVRRYPDLARSYPKALTRFEADPNCEESARVLAWIELFQGDVKQALAVLQAHMDVVSGDAASLDDESVHVWVEALLAAAQEAEDPTESLEAYQRAAIMARAPDDRLRCGMALADHLTEQGRSAEACRTLWDAGLSADADVLMSVGDGTRASPRLLIRPRLRRIADRLTEAESDALHKYIETQIDESVRALETEDERRDSRRRLAAITELALGERAGQRAQFELGRHRLDQKRYEAAEQWLLAAAHDGSDRALSIAASMSLCDLYSSSPFGLTAYLHERLGELKRRFGADLVPAIYASNGRDASDAAAVGDATVAAWVDARASALGVGASDVNRSDTLTGAFTLTGDIQWALPTPEKPILGRLVEFDTREGERRIDRLVFFDEYGAGVCYDANGDSMQWHTELRMPGRFDSFTVNAELDVDISRRAVVSGQVGVFAGQDGFHGIGLASGKRLWAKAREGRRESYNPWYADMRMAVGYGVVALLTRSDRVSLLRLADGATIWEHDLHDEGLAYIWIVDEVVLTSDEQLERIHLLDITDGRLLQRVLFQQPDPDEKLIRPAHTAGVLCGPLSTTSSDGLLAVDARTGKPLWESVLPKPLIQLFVPQDGYIGIGMLRGTVQIVDARTGEVILNRDVPAVRGVEDGVMLDGLLIVQHASAIMSGRRRQPGLMAVDIATGELAWHRHDLAPVAGFNAMLHLYGHVIPAFVIDEGEGRAKYRSKSLVTIDARTGRNIGIAHKLVGANSRTQVLNDMRLFQDRIVVATDKQYQALGIAPLVKERAAEE